MTTENHSKNEKFPFSRSKVKQVNIIQIIFPPTGVNYYERNKFETVIKHDFLASWSQYLYSTRPGH